MPFQSIIAGCRLYDLHMQQIPHRKQRRYHLTDDRCDRRPHHAPLKAEDKNGIEYNIDNSAGKC